MSAVCPLRAWISAKRVIRRNILVGVDRIRLSVAYNLGGANCFTHKNELRELNGSYTSFFKYNVI